MFDRFPGVPVLAIVLPLGEILLLLDAIFYDHTTGYNVLHFVVIFEHNCGSLCLTHSIYKEATQSLAQHKSLATLSLYNNFYLSKKAFLFYVDEYKFSMSD